MDVVALSASLLKQERLRELQRLVLRTINEQAARDQHENSLVDRRLVVSSGRICGVAEICGICGFSGISEICKQAPALLISTLCT